MKLADLVRTKGKFPLQNMGRDKVFAKEVQGRLITLGCLDPPADGAFGPISRLALAGFARQMRLSFNEVLTSTIANSLLTTPPARFISPKPGKDFASRIVQYMQLKKYFVARLPHYLTIVYVEGCDANGKPNPDVFDKWNDRRIVLTIGLNATPKILYNALATSEPGRFFTMNPINEMGTARIAFDQYKAWQVGQHHPHLQPPSRHEALVQAGNVKVFRDTDKNGIRTGDPTSVGSGMGINQHSGHNQNVKSIGKSSAGCLVARAHTDHKTFMNLVKKDPRFAANNGYMFMTAVIAGDDLAKRFPV